MVWCALYGYYRTGAGTTVKLSGDPEWDEMTGEVVYHYQYFAK